MENKLETLPITAAKLHAIMLTEARSVPFMMNTLRVMLKLSLSLDVAAWISYTLLR